MSCLDHADPPALSFLKKEKKTQGNLTLRGFQAHGLSDLTAKIKVWFMILEEAHYSNREHFRGSSVTTDEMLQDILPFETLPMFGHMVKYSPNKHGLTNFLEFAHISVRFGCWNAWALKIMYSFQAACNFFCGSWLSASIKILWCKDDVGSWNMLCKIGWRERRLGKNDIGATEHDVMWLSTI